MAEEEFHEGDKVSWRSHGSTATGKVVKYLVRSDKSGNEAVHKPGALRRERT